MALSAWVDRTADATGEAVGPEGGAIARLRCRRRQDHVLDASGEGD